MFTPLKLHWDSALVTGLSIIIMGCIGYLLVPAPQVLVTLSGHIKPTDSAPIAVSQAKVITAKTAQRSYNIDAPVNVNNTILKVNPNTASTRQLEQLPRVGPKMAKRIIDYRNTHGNFKTLEEITLVNGIGPKSFKRLLPMLTLEQ